MNLYLNIENVTQTAAKILHIAGIDRIIGIFIQAMTIDEIKAFTNRFQACGQFLAI